MFENVITSGVQLEITSNRRHTMFKNPLKMREKTCGFVFERATVGVVLVVCFAIVLSVRAQDAPLITIRKGDKVSVALGSLANANPNALEAALTASGGIEVAPAGKAGYVINAVPGSGGFSGQVVDGRGDVVLAKAYAGRKATLEFADDVVETLTGRPGFSASTIAFVSNRSGRKEIYTCDYDGSNVQQLTRDGAISVAPALSSDGQQLAYTGYQSGYADIYLIDLISGRRKRIVNFPGTNSGAAFSPDGRRIACSVSKDGNPEIYVVSTSGGGGKRLTRSRGAEASPSWSGDGSEIVFTSDDRGSPQLFRISSSGGSPRLIQTGYSYCTEPSWSPDGTKIAFNVRQGGSFQVAVIDLRGGRVSIVSGAGNAENPEWGADSRHLLYASGSSLVRLDTLSGKTTTIISGMGKISEPSWSR